MALAVLAPGVTLDGNGTPARIGGGGDPNIMMDGVSAMDTGSNRPLLQMNVESIAEVKVLTSGYQAEYGRASGVQVTAITKSGTNRFRGSVYDVERDSDWYANSKTNKLNGDPKTDAEGARLGLLDRRPDRQAGRQQQAVLLLQPGVRAAHRAATTSCGYRMPTALERSGDFSQTHRQQRQPVSVHQGPAADAAPARRRIRRRASATAAWSAGFPRTVSTRRGLNILKLYPMPNIDNVPAAQSYNYELTRPEESVLSWQPAVRVDYQPMQKLRATLQVLGVEAARPGLQRDDPRLQRHENAGRAGRQLDDVRSTTR